VYVQSRLPADIEKRLMLLSPTRRKESRRGLVGLDEGLLDFLRHNLDDPEINKLLLDPELHAEVLGQQAGKGYREVVSPITKTGRAGTPQLVPDKALEMSDIEEEMVKINSLIKQIQYDSTGKTENVDRNKLDELLQMFLNTKGKKGITATAKGGIAGIKHTAYGSRDKHPSLPELDEQTANKAALNQLFDNLLGNKMGIQPSGMRNKKGDMSGIPVEHDKDFENYPELGYDPNNRNLGSTYNNSILRSEGDKNKRYNLLLEHLVDRVDNIEKLTGKSFGELKQEMDTSSQRKLVKRFAGEDPKVREYMQDIESGRDTQSTGAVSGDKPVVVHAGEGSKVFLQTNGNGPADMQRTFRMFE
jgi:hypothetical protein